MGGQGHATFVSGDRSVAAVEADVHGLIKGADAEADVYAGDDVVTIRSPPFMDLAGIDPITTRALMERFEDTANSGSAVLYERVDGRYVATAHFRDQQMCSEAANYFLVEHDIRGEHG